MDLNTSQSHIFDQSFEHFGPLASLLRPKNFAEIVGQDHVLGPKGLLTQFIKQKKASSLILWGPPGCGKTTVAEILCSSLGGSFVKLSAVLSGVKDLRQAAEFATNTRLSSGKRTYLFVDEIHRFNKSQQDALLPHVENGTLTLIGATTENPAFSINSPLLSRCRIVVFKALDAQYLELLIDKGAQKLSCEVSDDARKLLLLIASGDARIILTVLEIAFQLAGAEDTKIIKKSHVELASGQQMPHYDKAGDLHYNIKSAFIKSMRGSDPDATCHYLTRMLQAGEEPRVILRHMIVFASEDVGNADPRALQIAVSALHAFEFIGMPEGYLPITHAAIYLACAPKSNAVLSAYHASMADINAHPDLEVPLQLRNAPTKLAKSLGHAKSYKYPHDFPAHFVKENYLPTELVGQKYYHPTNNGYEKNINERFKFLNSLSFGRGQGEGNMN